MNSNVNGDESRRIYGSEDEAIKRVMEQSGLNRTAAKELVDSAIGTGAIKIAPSITPSSTMVTKTITKDNFSQGDVIQVNGKNYYVEGGDVAGGARLRQITAESTISKASEITDFSERDKYFREHSVSGRITSDGFEESSFRTVSDVTGKDWKKVVVPTSSPEVIFGQGVNTNKATTVVSVADLTDTAPGTQYRVTANVGNGEEFLTLKYGENGNFTLISKNGVEYPGNAAFKEYIKVHTNDTHAYYSKSDGYKNLNSASTEGNKQARVNGWDSIDRPDVHDNIMHHTHVTQTVGYKGLEEVVNNKDLDPVVTAESRTDLILGLVNTKDDSKDPNFVTSPTGQWTIQDATEYIDDLAKSGRVEYSPSKKDSYFNDKYKGWLTELKGMNSEARAADLRQSVETLKTEFESVKNQMEEWYGSAAETAKEAIACILGKFIVTMGNIENALEPACKTVTLIIQALEDMERHDKELQDMLNDYDGHMASRPEQTLYRQVESVDKKTGRKTSHSEPYTNPDYITWDNDRIAKEKALEEKRKVLDELTLKVEEYYWTITNYQKAIKQFKSFVNKEGSNYHMVSTKENVVKYHDDILYEFENFARMPVITNLTDYKVGDIVLFDDSYGTLYKVVEAFDENDNPLGYLKIIAVDENGNPITGAEVITIWDQREIVPVNGKPAETTTSGSTGGSSDGKKPSGGGGGGGGGSNPPPDDPTPEEPTPEDPTPEEPTPEEPTPEDPTPDDPTPQLPEPDEPEANEPVPIGPPSTGIPDTGIDTMFSPSGLGIGAAAGVALGAAGLGLSSMMNASSEKKENDENESKENKTDN